MADPVCTDAAPKILLNMATSQIALDPKDVFNTAVDFELSPTDVLICSGAKCGSTWMQQIVHSLRSRGDMSFEEILEVIPVVEFTGNPLFPSLDTPQPFLPRAFMTHLRWEHLPKGPCKQIVVTRNPQDAVVSLYHFLGSRFFDLNEMPLNDFVEWMIIQERPSGTPFANAIQLRHLASWYPHRNDENVLWIHFEDLKEDLTKCIAMISDFLNIGVGDKELLKIVAEQASFDFMKKHKNKYNLHTVKRRGRELRGLTTEDWLADNTGRIRNGTMTEGAMLISEEMKAKMDAKWKAMVEPVTGYSTYEEMRAGVNKELGRSFETA